MVEEPNPAMVPTTSAMKAAMKNNNSIMQEVIEIVYKSVLFYSENNLSAFLYANFS